MIESERVFLFCLLLRRNRTLLRGVFRRDFVAGTCETCHSGEGVVAELMELPDLTSVANPKSIHGIYPYRGKISALDAARVIGGLEKDSRLLDPFCGSGTIVYEAAKAGFKSAHGTDINPLARWISEAKINCPPQIESTLSELQEVFDRRNVERSVRDPDLLFYFHETTLREIESIAPVFEDLSPYLKGCFAGAIALTARACNGYQWTSSTVGKNLPEKIYISFFDKLRAKVKKHHYALPNPDRAHFSNVDARALGDHFEKKSFDLVFTSPPYFDALDYTAYYARILYAVLGISVESFKSDLLQKVSTYEEDMSRVLSELVNVTTDRAKIIFVVGDKKTKTGVINGGEFFSKLLQHEPSMIFDRGYTASSSLIFDNLNKTKRREQIVVWDKGQW